MAERQSSARWWLEGKDNVHSCLAGVYRVVRDENAWRVDADEYHAELYSSSESAGVKGHSRRDHTYGPSTLPYNVSRSASDTMTSKIAKHRPLPEVLTQRGSWKNQKRARKMTQFLEGEFYRQRIYEKWGPLIVRDACIFGRGVLKVWREGKRLRTERAFPWEVFVSEEDARHGDPRNLYHCRSIDKGVALETFGRTESGGIRKTVKEALDSAGSFAFSEEYASMSRGSSTVDRVDVIEAWHLPSGEDAKDGRHVVIVQGATLVDEPWDHDYFPFAILHYNDPLTGFWGSGLVEQAEGYHYEINLASEKASEQFRMSGVGILVPDGSGIHSAVMRNGIFQIAHKNGAVPQKFDMDLVNEHTLRRPRELTQDCLNDLGMSQMSVQSQKPGGVTAAVALQTLDDIETERFMIFGRAYETWNLNIARLFIDVAKDIAAEYDDLAVSVQMKGGLLALNWADVYVDGVELRVFATSLLPQQLGARLQRLTDLFNTGVIDRATFMRHLDAPDLAAELDLETAEHLVIDETIEVMLDAEEDEGETAYIPPSAYQSLDWAAKRCQQRLNKAMLDGAPEYNTELLRRFLVGCDKAIAKRDAPPPVPANDAMGGPPGMAMKPPPALKDIGIPQGQAA